MTYDEFILLAIGPFYTVMNITNHNIVDIENYIKNNNIIFTNLNKLFKIINDNDIIYEIKLSKTSNYNIEDDMYITNNSDIIKSYNIYDFFKNINKYNIMLAIQQNGLLLKYIEDIDKTDILCNKAIEQTPYALKYVPNNLLSYNLLVNAIKKDGNILKYLKYQTDELCELAIEQNGLTLIYVHKQTPSICKKAVEQNGMALTYVKNKTDEICISAIKQNPISIIFIKNPSKNIIEYMKSIDKN